MGCDVIHYEKVSSTNLIAAAMVREGQPPEGTVITADWQESGRGQAGNSWESEPGSNLLMSVILYPSMVTPANQFIICKMISLAVYDLVASLTPSAAIKWPNDIYAGDDKIAGILIENTIIGDSLSGSIAGIGLNINQVHFRGGAPNPTSLRLRTAARHNVSHILKRVLSHLERRYAMIGRGRVETLDREYHESLYRRGEWHHYSDSGGRFEGMIEGVMPSGLLIVRRRDGSAGHYAFKEIGYIL